MQTPSIQRKLTTILSADAANYSGRMAHDEVGTVQALRRSRDIIDRAIENRGGRIANTSGDGLIAEFPSVVEAVAAAIVIQRDLNMSEDSLPFRLGLHLGDVIIEGDDLLGDGVNLAARLQEMAPEGGIYASRQVVDQVKNRLSADFRPMGPTAAKHLPEDIPVYSVVADGVRDDGKLADVTPKVTAAKSARTGSKAQEVPEGVDPVAHAKYVSFRKRTIGMCIFLVAIDFLTGPGTFWSVWPVGAFALMIWQRHNRVFKNAA